MNSFGIGFQEENKYKKKKSKYRQLAIDFLLGFQPQPLDISEGFCSGFFSYLTVQTILSPFPIWQSKLFYLTITIVVSTMTEHYSIKTGCLQSLAPHQNILISQFRLSSRHNLFPTHYHTRNPYLEFTTEIIIRLRGKHIYISYIDNFSKYSYLNSINSIKPVLVSPILLIYEKYKIIFM